MKLDHVLLGLLAIRPRSGYDLRRWLEAEGGFLRSHVHQSQIYRLLNRMAEQGLVAFAVDTRDKAPDAKVHRLTDEGRTALLAWARSPYEPTSRFQDPDFMARFIFTGMLDLPALLGVIDAELAYRRQQIAASRGRDRAVRFEEPIAEIDEPRARLVLELAHQQGAAAVDTWIDWLERTRRLLADGLPAGAAPTEGRAPEGDAP
ncbi:PadR family transcriptional regulator [Streptomyces sp. SID14478]|uniref:PadR family transcriptional regulator n=1 Tax=Streptomyces sp. SID14478 TaxID=2706073 RepID=UPI0013E082C0|nr:PadR family transcriptional regulator [Streptomyces sp. SID14478]NEB80858.1 PadR family transcriptional regulator [Streptomyces sp. SID14478]